MYRLLTSNSIAKAKAVLYPIYESCSLYRRQFLWENKKIEDLSWSSYELSIPFESFLFSQTFFIIARGGGLYDTWLLLC